jgi:hypothetical protein
MKKDKFNFIPENEDHDMRSYLRNKYTPETPANIDMPTYLRNLENLAANGMNINPNAFVVEIQSADGAKKKVWHFATSSFQNATGNTVKKVTRSLTAPDATFLGIIDWTGVNEKADRWGVLAALIYLDAEYQEFAKIGKLTHPDPIKYLDFFNQLVIKRSIPITYRPNKPVAGMISLVEMGKKLKTGDTWHASTSSELSKYLKAELDKADASQNQELHDNLAAFYELSSGFKVPKVTFKQVAKAVLTGGLTEEAGRKVVATITTGGLNLTKPGQKLSAKIDAKAEKIEAKADVLAGKITQKFKTISLALPRAAFYSLALINIFGICSHLQTLRENGEKGDASQAKKWNDVRNFWYKIGGSRGKFDTLIKNGSKKKPFLAKVKKKTGADGSEETDYLFAVDENYQKWQNLFGVDDAAVAAWVGIATSVIAVVKSIAGKPKDMDDETAGALDAEHAANKAEFDALVAQEAANKTPEALRDLDMIMPIWAWVTVGLGSIFAIGLIIYAAKHRKK